MCFRVFTANFPLWRE